MSEAVEFLGETEVPEQSCLITTREVSPQEMPNAMNETFPRLLAAAGASSSGAPFTVYSQCNGRDFLEVMLGGGRANLQFLRSIWRHRRHPASRRTGSTSAPSPAAGIFMRERRESI